MDLLDLRPHSCTKFCNKLSAIREWRGVETRKTQRQKTTHTLKI